MYALEQHGMFMDIGTPEDFVHAQAICDRLREVAFGRQQSGVAKTLETHGEQERKLKDAPN